MSGQGAFSEMKVDIVRILKKIPPGRVVTYGSIAKFLTISARHVAYILAGFSPTESKELPWHRVVGAQGWIKKDQKSGVERQASMLRKEGIQCKNHRLDLSQYEIKIKDLKTGLAGGKNYKEAALRKASKSSP